MIMVVVSKISVENRPLILVFCRLFVNTGGCQILYEYVSSSINILHFRTHHNLSALV
jgi:hypothetical protein